MGFFHFGNFGFDSQRQAPAAAAANPLTPGEFDTFYAFDPAGVTLAPDPDIGAYLDRGVADIDCSIIFGIKNVVASLASGSVVSRYAGLGMWYRSAANASGNMAEASGTIAFAFKPNSLTTAIDFLWGLENSLHGYLGLIPGDVSGYKVRANCGSAVNAESGDLPFGTWCVAIMRWLGDDLFLSVNGGAEVMVTAAADCFAGSLAQRFQLFANGGGNEFNGDCLLALVTSAQWDAAELYSRIVDTFPDDL